MGAALADHRCESGQPIGFVLTKPLPQQQFYVIKDRSGYVLGRSRRLEPAVAVLSSHLAALRSSPPNAVTARLRAVVSDRGTVTCFAWPLLFSPPAVERRLHAIGQRMLDQLVVHIDRDTDRVVLRQIPWTTLRDLDPGIGHHAPADEEHIVTRLLLPELPHVDAPSTAHTVAWLAPLISSEPDHAATLAIAERFVSQLDVVHVPLGDSGAVYRAIER